MDLSFCQRIENELQALEQSGLLKLLIHGGRDMTSLITHRLPSNEFQAGFEVMRWRMSGKVVLSR